MFVIYVVLVLGSIFAVKCEDKHLTEDVELFEKWQLKHNKIYETGHERFRVFQENVQIISALNELPKKSSADAARYGLTKFADLSTFEFQKYILNCFKPSKNLDHKLYKSKTTIKVPISFDWTDVDGVVTSVKDQGSVGTCWAFAGCANVESQWKLLSNQTVDLSTEAMIDCDGMAHEAKSAIACGPLGATMPGFYEFVMSQGSMMKWSDYPYCLGSGKCSPCAPEGYSKVHCGALWPIHPCQKEESCPDKYNPNKFVTGLRLRDYVTFNITETKLLQYLIEVGPLVAGIDGTDLQFYQKGVLEPNLCTSHALNHVVLIVGYGITADNVQFWRFKNSWGTNWGEDGFGRIIYGVGACGINTNVTSSILE